MNVPAHPELRLIPPSELEGWSKEIGGVSTMIGTMAKILHGAGIAGIDADCDRIIKRVREELERLRRAVSGGFGAALATNTSKLTDPVIAAAITASLGAAPGTDSGTDQVQSVPTTKDLSAEKGKRKKRTETMQPVDVK